MKNKSSKKKAKLVPTSVGATLPIPTEAKDMLTMIDRFLARDDGEAVELWSVLTGLRGPDQGADSGAFKVKRATTAVIRQVAFPLSARPSHSVIGSREPDGKRQVTVRKELENDHFRLHAEDAFEALGLNWDQFNPKPKR